MKFKVIRVIHTSPARHQVTESGNGESFELWESKFCWRRLRHVERRVDAFIYLDEALARAKTIDPAAPIETELQDWRGNDNYNP